MAPIATDHANSFQAVAMQVASLNASSVPISANSSCWITNQFVSVSFTPTYQAGADASQLAADGTLCLDYKSPDQLRYVALSIAVCNPEPELRQLMAGGILFTPPPGTGVAVTGYGAPQHGALGTPNGVSIECWSRAIVNGAPATTNKYWYWVFPYAQVWPTGETILENGIPAIVFTGYGYGNSSFGTGPQGTWPFTSDRSYQFARAASVPSITNGFIA